MLENRGFMMEEKYQQSERMFIDTFIFLIMNTLPRMLKETAPIGETSDEEEERYALRNRCTFFQHKLGVKETKRSFHIMSTSLQNGFSITLMKSYLMLSL